MPRPYVLLSVAVSIDGHIDDAGPGRLLLSNDADFDRVDQVRAGSDAILIGAATLRTDDPRLVVRSEQRRAQRRARGLPEYPLKVVLTSTGDLDPELRFWHYGGDKIVYSTEIGAGRMREPLAGLAEVVPLGPSLDFGRVLDELGARGVRQLMVEGGGQVHTAFLSAGLVDEIQLAVAPIVVGDDSAPRFLNPAGYPGGPTRRLRMVETRPVGDVVLIRYLP